MQATWGSISVDQEAERNEGETWPGAFMVFPGKGKAGQGKLLRTGEFE